MTDDKVGLKPDRAGTDLEKKGHSPLPTKSPQKKAERPSVETFDFPEAIRRITNGERVTKLEWGNPAIYGLLRNSEVQIFLVSDMQFHTWIISHGDLVGTDWVSVSTVNT